MDVSLIRPYPLDALGAQTQGMIGYWLTQALRNAGACKPIVSLLTQTLVSATDPAFGAPTTFVGRAYARDEAEGLAALHGWRVGRDGTRWRRVVPSPEPLGFVEESSISHLLGGGMTVICGGGGGVPVSVDTQGRLRGREAVVDKDLTAALLATTMDADRLVLLTDVPAVMANFGATAATPLRHLRLDQLSPLALPSGSMAPKVEACRRFVEATGRSAAIGALTDAASVLAGNSGTLITAGPIDPAAVLHPRRRHLPSQSRLRPYDNTDVARRHDVNAAAHPPLRSSLRDCES